VGIKYYMDVHVPAAITEGLRRRGLDVLTSQEDGTREADDEDLLTRATDLGRTLVSQDQDLLRIASAWQQAGRAFSGVVFSPQQGTSIGRCVEDLELLATCCTPGEILNRVLFLPLT
jgi:hypothetical protein